MANLGTDVIDIGSTKVGQKYVLGSMVPLDNPNWNGPWDCAEFTSWCAYQAYGLLFGMKPHTLYKAEPYSGHWYDDAKKLGTVLSWQDALSIPGAALIRSPTPALNGHVAFAVGDGDKTLEARGAKYGVGIFSGAKTRPWNIGCLLPGVEYPGAAATKPLTAAKLVYPGGYLWLKKPNFRGGEVLALQKALKSKGVDPGPIDGEFGPNTYAAVVSFQGMKGIEVDGVVGPMTAKALGLLFPIAATVDDHAKYANYLKFSSSPIDLKASVGGIDLVTSIVQKGKSYQARTLFGHTFLIGKPVPYTDDMNRIGVNQGNTEIKDSLQFGVFAPNAQEAKFGKWAYFISPILNAEGKARYAALNTYDRAAFTFGAPQLAAHTPRKNFVLYLRALLALPNANAHFPELSLKPNNAGKTTIHLTKGGSETDLEKEVVVTRPNGKKETQLPYLMGYLNPSPIKVDDAELTAAARLMNWLRLDPSVAELQIEILIEAVKEHVAGAKANVSGFDGSDWRTAIWIADILHHGRGKYSEMSLAMKSGNPEAALMKIGASSYSTRIKTVAMEVAALANSGVMKGFKV